MESFGLETLVKLFDGARGAVGIGPLNPSGWKAWDVLRFIYRVVSLLACARARMPSRTRSETCQSPAVPNRSEPDPAGVTVNIYHQTAIIFPSWEGAGITLAERVRQARERRAWSQDDLARNSGVNTTTIQRIESGENAPKPRTIRKLADALGVRVEWLTVGEAPMVNGET